MKSKLPIFVAVVMMIPFFSCNKKEQKSDMNIIYLHHSTGEAIWNAAKPSLITKAVRRVSKKLAKVISAKPRMPILFKKYNEENDKNYLIKDMAFPKKEPYGWNNYPFDYYNIWVKNAGNEPYMEEPTLEMLTKDYQVIIFKHCYPASNILADLDSADINSDVRTISNYKLQYNALRDKLHEFPDTKFILFTGAVQVKYYLKEDEAKRAKEFYKWVLNEWDVQGDNIYLWDFYSLQTEGGLYFKDEYALTPYNSHPNGDFSRKVVKLLFNRIIDVIENDGNFTEPAGLKK